jgi:hypothetical protein
MVIWILYALLSAFFAALVVIFGKLGVQNIDATLATTIRTIVMAGFLIFVSLFLGKLSLLESVNNKALQFIALSGLAGAMSWLFYYGTRGELEGVGGAETSRKKPTLIFRSFAAKLGLFCGFEKWSGQRSGGDRQVEYSFYRDHGFVVFGRGDHLADRSRSGIGCRRRSVDVSIII